MAATPWLPWSALKIEICFSIMKISNNPVEGGCWSLKRSSSRPNERVLISNPVLSLETREGLFFFLDYEHPTTAFLTQIFGKKLKIHTPYLTAEPVSPRVATPSALELESPFLQVPIIQRLHWVVGYPCSRIGFTTRGTWISLLSWM